MTQACLKKGPRNLRDGHVSIDGQDQGPVLPRLEGQVGNPSQCSVTSVIGREGRSFFGSATHSPSCPVTENGPAVGRNKVAAQGTLAGAWWWRSTAPDDTGLEHEACGGRELGRRARDEYDGCCWGLSALCLAARELQGAPASGQSTHNNIQHAKQGMFLTPSTPARRALIATAGPPEPRAPPQTIDPEASSKPACAASVWQ